MCVCVDALESASDKLHKEKMQWQQEQEKLQQEVAELRSRLAQGERSVVWWPPSVSTNVHSESE